MFLYIHCIVYSQFHPSERKSISNPGTQVSKLESEAGLVRGSDTASGCQTKVGSQPVAWGLGTDLEGSSSGMGRDIAAMWLGLLRQDWGVELQLESSFHRREPALAEAGLRSCLASPHGHQREGGAALICALSKLAQSPASKTSGEECNQGPYSHLRSQGAATRFSSASQRSTETDGSHFNCASISDT